MDSSPRTLILTSADSARTYGRGLGPLGGEAYAAGARLSGRDVSSMSWNTLISG